MDNKYKKTFFSSGHILFSWKKNWKKMFQLIPHKKITPKNISTDNPTRKIRENNTSLLPRIFYKIPALKILPEKFDRIIHSYQKNHSVFRPPHHRNSSGKYTTAHNTLLTTPPPLQNTPLRTPRPTLVHVTATKSDTRLRAMRHPPNHSWVLWQPILEYCDSQFLSTVTANIASCDDLESQAQITEISDLSGVPKCGLKVVR